MIEQSQFKAAWWLASSHAQTVYPTLFKRTESLVDKVERIELPDGDFIDTAWAIQDLPQTSPLVILLHGLGGSVNSTYVNGLIKAFYQKGWRSVLMHFRGASEEPNRHARAYHSGDTQDLDFFIKQIDAREPASPKAAVGVSLGGNVLLKWLGENDQPGLISAAVAVSVPFELRLVADRINRGFSQVYQYYLLKKLRRTFGKKRASLSQKDQEPPVPEALRDFERWNCFWTFDDRVTAPLHGFSSVHAYYRQSSCRQYLKNIQVPTLILQAKDDPFMTPEVLPRDEELSAAIQLELSEKGGHVGFVSGMIPGRAEYWLEQRIPDYLNSRLNSKAISKDCS